MSREMLSSLRAVAAGVALAASCATGATSAGAQDWAGQVTVYGWGAGVSGDFTPRAGAPTLSFDKSLSEVLEDLDAAFFATGLVRRGDLILFGDLTYTSSSREGLVPLGVSASGEVTLRALTLAAGKRFDLDDRNTLDVLGGLRAWSLEGRVSVPAVGESVAPEKTFVDPIVAVRFNTQLAPRWSVLSYVDIGGFGAGSEMTWQVAVTGNYQATDNLYVSFGYRHLHVDYRDGGTVFDGSMSGPLAGVTWRF